MDAHSPGTRLAHDRLPVTSAAECPVLSRVQAVAGRHAGLSAVVGPDGRLTYRELWEQVQGWRARLAGLDLPARSVVAVLTDGGADLPAALLGVRAAGLVPLLLDPLSPGEPSVLIGAVGAGATLNLTTAELAPGAPGGPRVLPDGAGYLVFSSGSQGAPKGIVGSARGLVHFLDWEVGELGLRPGTATALLTSPSFDVVYRDLLLPLFAGGELHVPGHQIRTAPSQVLPWIIEREVQVIHAVPSLSARWIEATPGLRAPRLGWTAFAGERLFDRHVARWRSVAPNSRILNLYGPTETTLAAFRYRVPDLPSPGVQPVGQPLPEIRLSLEPVGEGAAASVTIESPYGSLGYLADTCAEDDLLRLSRTAGLTRFRTQDRGRLDAAGELVIDGRLDTLVKRNGSFVDTALIEAAAAELDGVRAACCLQVEVSGSGRVVLAVECAAGHAPAGLRRALARRLGFSLLPDEVVPLPRMPLLPSGKVDRRGVRALLDPDAELDTDLDTDLAGGADPDQG